MLILRGYGTASPAVQHVQNTCACKLFLLNQLTNVLRESTGERALAALGNQCNIAQGLTSVR